MTASHTAAGYFRSGLPYNRLGHGQQILVLLQGLVFDNKPLSAGSARMMFSMYSFLYDAYTLYAVTRKPGLPAGYSMADMANDYALTISSEFGGPVDVIGTSTGGSIAQHLAADHPELIRRLILHASAHSLGDAGKTAQIGIARLAAQRKWRKASADYLGFMMSPSRLSKITAALGALFMAWTAPADPSDLIVTIQAEDRHDFRARLAEITAPTLVIAGARDPFYSEALLRETAAGIPNARLVLYPDKGHAPTGKQFASDVLGFLREDGR